MTKEMKINRANARKMKENWGIRANVDPSLQVSCYMDREVSKREAKEKRKLKKSCSHNSYEED